MNLASILGQLFDKKQIAPPMPLQARQANFQFNGNLPLTKGGLPAPKQTFTPQIQIPQNYNPLDGYSVYGDSQGNRWWENDQTGHRIPIFNQSFSGDQQINPRPASPALQPPLMQLPVQYQRGPSPAPLSFLI